MAQEASIGGHGGEAVENDLEGGPMVGDAGPYELQWGHGREAVETRPHTRPSRRPGRRIVDYHGERPWKTDSSRQVRIGQSDVSIGHGANMPVENGASHALAPRS